MGLLGFIKDVALLPVDVVLDATMITPTKRMAGDMKEDTPFGTVDRLASMVKNIEETYKK